MVGQNLPLSPSTKRPVPLARRHDLMLRRIGGSGRPYWVAKDPLALTYYHLQPEQHALLELLDGRRNLEELRARLIEQFPYSRPQAVDIQASIADLHAKRLVRSLRFGQGQALYCTGRKQAHARRFSAVANLLYLRLPGWDPETTLRRIEPLVGWMFHPWAVMLAVSIVLSALGLLAIQADTFAQRLPGFQQFFGWPNLVYLWGTLAATKLLHELGHGIACRHYGGECHQIGVILLVFSPTLYCDVSDSWMLPNKWQRIVIGAAGMYVEMVVSALALFGWWFTRPGLLNHLLLNVFFVSAATTVIFNLNPLMRYDGYYMLSDFLEIPNLSRKAQRLLQETFGWHCLGIRPRPDPFMPVEGHFWFVAYAVASAIYRWVVLFGVTLFLYVVLKPYELQSIGIALACLSLAGVAFGVGRGALQIVRAPRQEPLSRPKVATAAAALLIALGLGLFVPIPWRMEAAFYLEPRGVQHVYANIPGQLCEICVVAGDRVSAGDHLLTLSDADKQIRHQELLTELRTHEIELDTQMGIHDATAAVMARERLDATRRLVADYERQLQQLYVIAPIDGVVVAAPRTPEPQVAQPRTALATWWGTPLDSPNCGCLLEAGTHLLSVAPDERFQAVLLVDQADRGDFEVGRAFDIKFDHLPTRTYRGVVREIAERHQEFAPAALSNKQGGSLPTVTDRRGRERLTSHAYQAVVDLDGDAQLLKSGLRGQARCDVDHRSVAEWVWRAIRQTFHFRL